MNRQIINSLLLALGLICVGAAVAADATGQPAAGGVYVNENENGSVELSNIPSSPDQEPVVAAPAPDAAVAAPSEGPATKDIRQQYRETMLQGGEGTTAANPAVSRRYKMMDRETYRATVLGITPESPPPPPPPPPTPSQ